MSIRGGRHQQSAEQAARHRDAGQAGVYVLHFARAAGAPYEYGDALHYVGQSVDLHKRFRQHASTWRGEKSDGTARIRRAGEEGIGYTVAHYMIVSGGEDERLQVEAEWTADPPAHCPECDRLTDDGLRPVSDGASSGGHPIRDGWSERWGRLF